MPRKHQVAADKETDGDTFFCYHCEYATRSKCHLINHMNVHNSMAKYQEITGNRSFTTCKYCNKTFVRKRSLDDHIVKIHPDFIASVSSKVQECSRCSYKTTITKIDGNRTFRRCIYCNKTFIRKRSLDDHIVKAHPEFIASVGSKVHECSRCTYKTILTSHLKGHNLAKHPDIAGNRVLIRCIYCNKTFTSKLSLDDHIVKKHPDFIVSVSRKVHECSRCTYKTILTSHLKGHNLAKHPDIAGNRVLIRCIYCNKTFTSKLSLDDHIVKKHPDFIASVSRKVHECSRCTYKTTFTSCLKGHIRAKHPDIAYNIIINRCIYCNKTFTSKLSLDDHIVKRHPDFIASVSRKVHECSRCTYKTIITSHLKGHNLAKHPDIAGNRVLIRCIYCKKTFTSKRSLEDHIVKTHPDFIASVSRKVHKCTKCSYKTVQTSKLKRHMAKHPDVGNLITNKCTYCNKTFGRKQDLDGHIIKSHPDFIASVSNKVHECTKCSYKTTVSTSLLKRHMVKHPDIAGNHITIRCNYCNKTFTRKQSLDDHIVRKHPDFIASVSRKVYESAVSSKECTKCQTCTTYKFRKCAHCNATFRSKLGLDGHIVERHPDFIESITRNIYECTKCTYKAVASTYFKNHMAQHPKMASTNTLIRCIYCNMIFVRKRALDDHIVRKHPDFIASASSKVHECTECTYKTISTTLLKQHMAKHLDTGGIRISNNCMYCDKKFLSKPFLDDHVIRTHPDFIASVTSKIHECRQCTYKTTIIRNFREHSVAKHPEISDNCTFRCTYCNKTFKFKRALDDHIIEIHPDFIACVSRKVHECTKCTYKTVSTWLLKRHMVKHPDIAETYKFRKCAHCNAKFRSKLRLDDHVVNKHPDFIGSVTSEIYECTKCTYKTTTSTYLKNHTAKHLKIASTNTLVRCTFCNKTFLLKQTLDDHVLREHLHLIETLGTELNVSTKLDFKTAVIDKTKDDHMLKQPETADGNKPKRCEHFNAEFESKQMLDAYL
nr:unnamed protein product [Callosobruchus analis]